MVIVANFCTSQTKNHPANFTALLLVADMEIAVTSRTTEHPLNPWKIIIMRPENI